MVKYGFEQKSFQSKSTNFVFFILLVAALFVWAILLSPDLGGLVEVNYSKNLRVDFVNVGQGDAILIRTPKGKTYLIDGGASMPLAEAKRQKRELIQHYLRDKGITKLDGIVITHWHNDHLGGVVSVLRLFKVDKIWECGSKFETEVFKKYEKWCQKRRVQRLTARAGDVLEWGNELFVQVLHPQKVINSSEFSDTNNMSVTLLVRYGKFQALLCGDIEEDAEREILKYGKGLKSQVIKVPHHGSDTSDFFPFLKTVAPEVAVVHVGRKNPFKHPKKRAIDRYYAVGSKIYRTDKHGNIRLIVGGKDNKDFRFEVDRRL
jgi:beta-lactamase superfamily II metal-dependent hydrolase